MEYASIIAQREIKTNPIGNGAIVFTTYEWEGENEIADLSHYSLVADFRNNPGALKQEVITLGNLRLRIIDRDSLYWKVARDGWKARLYQAAWPVKWWCLWVWYRLIWTLAVWGLATYEPGRIPSWRDIKVLK